MDPKEGQVATDHEIRNRVGAKAFGDVTGYFEYKWPDGWRTKWDNSIARWRWTFMGNPPTPTPWNGPILHHQTEPEAIVPTQKLDKGDYCQLKVSKRKFRILDERKDDQNNFEELCKFDDDNRNPIWLPHSWLVGEVNILEKA